MPPRFAALVLVAFVVGAVCGFVLSSAIREFPSAIGSEQSDLAIGASDGWLIGSADEKYARIERHLRGMDVAMAEIGYRYDELVHAGKTRNWDYAQTAVGVQGLDDARRTAPESYQRASARPDRLSAGRRAGGVPPRRASPGTIPGV
jgi:hypothetical protein